MKTEITKIQRFSAHDGDGISTTVFFRGCPLKCFWCHNPETANNAPVFFYTPELCISCKECENVCERGAHTFSSGEHEIQRERCAGCFACIEACPSNALERCAYTLDTEEIMETVLRDRSFYSFGGGLTLSGGEPMYQAEAAFALLRAAGREGIRRAVETSGVFPKEYIMQLSKNSELLLWDIKDTNEKRLFENTGAHLDMILENLYAADSFGCKTELRCIMINGVNMESTALSAIAEIYKQLKHCRGVRLIPYHPYGLSKSVRLSEKSRGGKELVPSKASLDRAKRFLSSLGVRIMN